METIFFAVFFGIVGYLIARMIISEIVESIRWRRIMRRRKLPNR